MEAPLVGIVMHPSKDVRASVETLQRWHASGRGQLVARRIDAARLGPGIEVLDDVEFCERVDLVVSLGGDGTMLGSMRLVAARPVPVLGVNYGNVGFLVEIEPDELAAALERMSAGDYSLEPHHALEAVLTWSGARTNYLAFNDLTIVRRPGAGQVSADLTIGGLTYGYYRADAVVASTPAGSTAYNYAAGGPVLSPALSGSVVTPVAPMAGIDRSVVLAAKERYRFDIAEGTRSAALEVDGLVVGEVATGAQLEVRLRKNAGTVIRLDAERHGRTGRVKLSLLDLPVRPDQLIELIPSEVRQRLRQHDRPEPEEG
ncbi:NAD(+)/NADH kinase [Curtobacterium sp. MCBD17_003]|uniref:NAD(+)/NADH kinase n=1 Tax=Curtobacterium sp. MCBD17_003 TaxID=2175667 RepID=UPI000DA70A4E|nr:NAD(+)/NADH kinase [Curtobacterium sp. MCBD17_003]WIE54742.1 NAD(+)/NADH kinase [Curtobacterium sp. MCBD17_003]